MSFRRQTEPVEQSQLVPFEHLGQVLGVGFDVGAIEGASVVRVNERPIAAFGAAAVIAA